MNERSRRAGWLVLPAFAAVSACADKAPEPRWPEPPPPTLAEPIGQDAEPTADAGTTAPTEAEPDASTAKADAAAPETNDPEEGAVRVDR